MRYEVKNSAGAIAGTYPSPSAASIAAVKCSDRLAGARFYVVDSVTKEVIFDTNNR